MTELGPDWVPDADGIPHRTAARVVLFDADGRILLISGHDAHDPDHRWWFTVGGGIEPGEEPRQAAVRELAEETGIAIDPGDLVGPVAYRRAAFHFLNVTARQDEWFFVAHVPDEAREHAGERHFTALEDEVLDDEQWWSPDELDAKDDGLQVYPRNLPELARQWRDGWDGDLLLIEELEGIGNPPEGPAATDPAPGGPVIGD